MYSTWNLEQPIILLKTISKNVKEYTNEEDLRDKEEPEYEELYMWAVKVCNGYDSKLEANVVGKAAEFWINCTVEKY